MARERDGKGGGGLGKDKERIRWGEGFGVRGEVGGGEMRSNNLGKR